MIDRQFVADMAAAEALSTQAKRDKARAQVWAALLARIDAPAVPPVVDPPPVVTPPVVDPPPVVTPPASSGTFLRPFADTSPWNMPAPATFQPVTGAMTVQIRTDATYGGSVNIDKHSCPIIQASTADPLVTIVDASHGVTLKAYVPAGSKADPGSDGSIIIVQPNGDVVEGYWAQWTSPTTMTASRVGRTRIDGNGGGPQQKVVDATGKTVSLTQGCRASASSWMAGMIRAHEVDPTHPNYSGGIHHVLAMAVPGEWLLWTAGAHGYDANGYGTALGYTTKYGFAFDQDWDGQWVYKNDAGQYGPIPMGQLFAIPKSVNLDAQGYNPTVLSIAKALQNYGAAVVDKTDNDNGSGPVFYGEPAILSTAAGQVWADAWWKDGHFDRMKKLLVACA